MQRIETDWLRADPAQQVCAMLTDAGHQAWFVGGCVRNALLGAPVTDMDVTTDAHPDRVVDLAKAADLKCIPTGIDHGTVTVIAGDVPFEITTFRRDVATDGRRATVAFSDSIEEDAARRDFTMNALYAAPDGEVCDPLGGLPDLEARRVRFIGDADERIAEDYLRILRFFRFHAIYGDLDEGIDPDGLAACAGGLDGLENVSAERIGAEMRKLLAAKNPAPSLAAMRASGVLLRILPGAGTGLLQVLLHVEETAGLPPDWLRRLAALGGEGAVDALRLSKAEATRHAQLITGLEGLTPAAELGYRQGADMAIDILTLRSAAFERELDPDQMDQVRHGAAQTFPIKAADLMPDYTGPALGEQLSTLEARWIASGFTLTRESLLAG